VQDSVDGEVVVFLMILWLGPRWSTIVLIILWLGLNILISDNFVSVAFDSFSCKLKL